MGLDDMVNKAKGLLGGHEKEVGEGIDKTAEMAKDKIGHENEVDAAAEKAKGLLGEQS